VLELRDLVKHYQVGGGEPICAVDHVSMSVVAGEFVALYGPSGSGKTTLIELIAGLCAPDSGSVLVDGEDVAHMSRNDAADYRLHTLGMVLQPHTLPPGTKAIRSASLKLLLDNVRRAPAGVEPLLARLGLGERLNHRTEQLSMGERQRVLIAIALSARPKLVLADEPTASLDTQRTREVLALLRDLCRERKMALLLATHDPEVVAFADRAHELRDGRLGEYRPDSSPAVVELSPTDG
jgi:putative ABC transport system ATP-binding protein